MTESLDVYWLDGTTLSRTTVPELVEKSRYKGGDRFRLEGRLIVRTIPVYRDGDPVGKPTGGTRTVKYDFKEGAFTLNVQSERTADPSDGSRTRESCEPLRSIRNEPVS